MIRTVLRALGILPPVRPVRPTAAEMLRIPRAHPIGELTVPIPVVIPPELDRDDDDRRRDAMRHTTDGVRQATAALRDLQALLDPPSVEAAHVRRVAAYHHIDDAQRALREALTALPADHTTGDQTP
ncbi:hypothetical protein FZ103_00130 [Streptomonospora sp. PA3]|uniref:hypothetical protein n=1 Tax=Streptomonospora sp. PA3 TaxID=2607326 RepID=UPI0012DF072C|nr:hypothetical protein [Streptomonospora sp. PA3]MUL39601.1 hypothetical protein [Streptomonospora sp. PA3]